MSKWIDWLCDKLIDRLHNAFLLALIVFITWLSVAHAVYAIRNPDMTEMRRFLNTWDALMFRK